MLDLFGETPDPIRSLSWKQPYAELMFHGKIETRTWNTNYRGLVLICASKTGYHRDQVINISGIDNLKRIEDILGVPVSFKGGIAIKGYAIGIGELVDSRPMTKDDEDACYVKYQEPWIEEKKILVQKGLYYKDKKVEKRLWCHIYQNVRRITPVLWSGTQGWGAVDNETQRQIGLM